MSRRTKFLIAVLSLVFLLLALTALFLFPEAGRMSGAFVRLLTAAVVCAVAFIAAVGSLIRTDRK